MKLSENVTPMSAHVQPVVARLREATRRLHLDLHEHPLMAELFTNPSHASYQAVLQGFYAFYRCIEPVLVESAAMLGAVEQYPKLERTEWLESDLQVLGASNREAAWPDFNWPPPLNEIGELVGWLYVVKGSALGGQSILREICKSLDVDDCSRFLRGHGTGTVLNWRKFQTFCDKAEMCRHSRIAAVVAAKFAFRAFGDCLTWSWQEHLRRIVDRRDEYRL